MGRSRITDADQSNKVVDIDKLIYEDESEKTRSQYLHDKTSK